MKFFPSKDIVKFKYLRSDSVCTVRHRQNDSLIWADLLKIREIYLQGRVIEVHNGKSTLFWHEEWNMISLYATYWCLCEQKNITVFQVKSGEIQLSFTRWLVDNLKSDWDKVLADVSQYHFKHGEDFVKWKFGNKGSFSVQSVYNAITTNENGPLIKKYMEGQEPYQD